MVQKVKSSSNCTLGIRSRGPTRRNRVYSNISSNISTIVSTETISKKSKSKERKKKEKITQFGDVKKIGTFEKTRKKTFQFLNKISYVKTILGNERIPNPQEKSSIFNIVHDTIKNQFGKLTFLSNLNNSKTTNRLELSDIVRNVEPNIEPKVKSSDSLLINPKTSSKRFDKKVSQMSFRKKILLSATLSAGLLTGAGLTGAGWAYKNYIIENPGEELKKEKILASLSQETEIYYNDEITKLSSLTGNGSGKSSYYRKPVSLDKIPKSCIDGLIANEDDQFMTHHGFNFKGILRTIYNRLIHGKGGGGSSLTQQTAENLFRDYFKNNPSSLKGKLEEAVYALKLEAHHSKEDILYYYFNQYHVIKHAVGIANAFKYFFNDDIESLNHDSDKTLIKCAYLSGIVKGPRNYDPFLPNPLHYIRELKEISRKNGINPTSEEIKKWKNLPLNKKKELNKLYALKKAKRRTKAVLRNMRAEVDSKNSLTEEEKNNIKEKYSLLMKKVDEEGIPFNKGELIFNRADTLVELVNKEIKENQKIQRTLNKHGITSENFSTSGLIITTTLDAKIQQKTEYLLRHDASEKDWQLSGYHKIKTKENISRPNKLKPGKFNYGEIIEIKDNQLITNAGVIGPAEIKRATLFDKQGKKKNPYLRKVTTEDQKNFLSQFKIGDTVYYSVKEITEDGHVILDLEQKPHFELATLFANPDGGIITIMGSYNNKDFNYVYDGQRQIGSSIKPLIDTLALKLGVNLTDKFWNYPEVFWNYNELFTKKNYSKSTHPELTLWTSLMKSKNIPHVDLIYQLANKLSESKLREISLEVGFDRQDNEPITSKKDDDLYIKRIRDKEGILFTPIFKEWAKYNQAKKELLNNEVLNSVEKQFLKTLSYGFKTEEKLAMLLDYGEKAEQSIIRLKRNWKSYLTKKNNLENILAQGRVSITHVAIPLKNDHQEQEEPDSFFGKIGSLFSSKKTKILNYEEKVVSVNFPVDDFYVDFSDNGIVVHYAPDNLKGLVPFDRNMLNDYNFNNKFNLENIVIGDGASFEMLESIKNFMENISWDNSKNYTLEYLVRHPQVKLRLVERKLKKELAELGVDMDLGVKKDYHLNTIMALGAMGQPLTAMLKAYNGILNGKLIKPYIIEQIRLRTGEIIYQAQPVHKNYNINKKLAYSIAQNLHAITTNGTAPFLNKIGYKYLKSSEDSESIIIDNQSIINSIDNNTNGFGTGSVKEKLKGKLVVDIDGQKYMVWTGGKTGTTNNYTNSWFTGMYGQELGRLMSGVVWLGEYKNNKGNMTNGRVKFTGSSSAKLWGDIARNIMSEETYQKIINPKQKGLLKPVDSSDGFYIYIKSGEKVDNDKCLILPNKNYWQDYCVTNSSGVKELHPITYIYSDFIDENIDTTDVLVSLE